MVICVCKESAYLLALSASYAKELYTWCSLCPFAVYLGLSFQRAQDNSKGASAKRLHFIRGSIKSDSMIFKKKLFCQPLLRKPNMFS